MGELRLERLRYTIAGLIFAVLLREAATIPWLEFGSLPLSALLVDGAWVRAAAVVFGGAFALWGLVPIERRWPLIVAVAVAAVPVFFVALNIVDPEGRLDSSLLRNVGRDDTEVGYSPGMLLAIVSSVGALVVSLWTLRYELRR